MNTGKIIIISIAVMIVVALLGMATKALASGAGTFKKSVPDNAAITSSNKNFQEASIKVVGGTYVLTPSTFKEGIPVRLTADMNTFYGCSRSIVIPEFGIKKTVSGSDNTIEFTPTKSGTFIIACSMYMYKGTFSVSGSGSGAIAQVSAPSPKSVDYSPDQETFGGTCGAGPSGGCGCGGY